MKSMIYFVSACLLISVTNNAMHTKQNRRKERQLIQAVAQNNISRTTTLLSRKKSKQLANTVDHLGYSLLHKVQSAAAACLLLAARAASDNTHAINALTPLHVAKTAAIAQALIGAHADVNARDVYERTPLHYARSATIAAALLAAGTAEVKIKQARANAADKNKRTPLFMAVSGAIVDELITGGAYVDFRDQWGNTPLHRAANADVVDALIAHGASVNAYNTREETPFEALADDLKHNKNSLRALLQHYALITYQRKQYPQYAQLLQQILEDDLLVACFIGDDKAVGALLHNNPGRINQAVYGIRPIAAAASQGQNIVVRMLIAHGAYADVKMVRIASRNKMYQTVKILRDYVRKLLVFRARLQQLQALWQQTDWIEQLPTSSSTSSTSTSSATSSVSPAYAVRMSLQPSLITLPSVMQISSQSVTAPVRRERTYAAAVGCRCPH